MSGSQSSTGTTPHRPPPGLRREYHKRHVVFEISGEAIAISTLQPNAPVCMFYVLAREEPVTKQVNDIDRETLLAFGCVEDVVPISEGRLVKIIHLEKYVQGKDPALYKFCVEG
jgi:hypothetical protein